MFNFQHMNSPIDFRDSGETGQFCSLSGNTQSAGAVTSRDLRGQATAVGFNVEAIAKE